MMSLPYFTEMTFEAHASEVAKLEKGEYDQCTFIRLDLSGADLKQYIFSDCTFKECNLSLSNITAASFRQIKFVACKMLGIRWENCNPFLFSVFFDQCILDMASFYGIKLKKTTFKSCQMREVDFTEADLSQAVLEDCDLHMAVFDETNLSGADLRTARQYVIDPNKNIIKKARFCWPALAGLLTGFNIEIE